tara:strand:- start:174 stop:386 length:213 start_codon:yes stop_codon:yes gene_type:complete
MKSKIKNRQWHQPYKENKDSKYEMFLVRWHDEKQKTTNNEGPYHTETEAFEVLKSYLKDGICSWLVSYSG